MKLIPIQIECYAGTKADETPRRHLTEICRIFKATLAPGRTKGVPQNWQSCATHDRTTAAAVIAALALLLGNGDDLDALDRLLRLSAIPTSLCALCKMALSITGTAWSFMGCLPDRTVKLECGAASAGVSAIS